MVCLCVLLLAWPIYRPLSIVGGYLREKATLSALYGKNLNIFPVLLLWG